MQGLVQPSHPRCSAPFSIQYLEFDFPYHTLQSSTTALTSSQSRLTWFVGASRGGITWGQPRTPSLPLKVARNLLRDLPEYLDLHYAASVCSQALLNARKAYSASSRASLSSRVPSLWKSSRSRVRTAVFRFRNLPGNNAVVSLKNGGSVQSRPVSMIRAWGKCRVHGPTPRRRIQPVKFSSVSLRPSQRSSSCITHPCEVLPAFGEFSSSHNLSWAAVHPHNTVAVPPLIRRHRPFLERYGRVPAASLGGGGFCGARRRGADSWNDTYAALKDYRTKHPGEWPLWNYVAPDGLRLGLWCREPARISEEKGSGTRPCAETGKHRVSVERGGVRR
jgi:hypothetical protein